MTKSHNAHINYSPRGPFVEFHRRSQSRAVLVCHRRAGKTVATIHDLFFKALQTTKKKAFFAYVAPLKTQVKQIAWDYLLEIVRPLGSFIKINNQELSVVLPNGSTIRLFGADNPDSLRGLYFDGIVLDEVGDMRSEVWTVIRPALADRNGWVVFIGTPRGKNFFYDMREIARRDPGWLYIDVKASESGIITTEELQDARKTMSEEQYRQEFENDFESSNVGAYYGKEMRELEQNKQITKVPYDSDSLVNVSFDLGISDSTAMWFWQEIGFEIRVIDYHEDNGQSMKSYHNILKSKPYRYGTIWLPHDARARSLQTGVSIIEQMIEFGWDCQIVPKMKLHDGIQAVRKLLPRCWFDENATYNGIQCLKAYQKEYNAEKKVFNENPKHDWSSHGADSFRYMILSISKESRSTADIVNKVPAPTMNEMTLEGLWSTARRHEISKRL